MSRRVKRRITFAEPMRRSRRPVEKIMKNTDLINTGSTQSDSLLFTTSDPVTAGGWHWDVVTRRRTDPTGGTGEGGVWAIVIVRDTITGSTLNTTNEGEVYSPAENCIVAGVYKTGLVGLSTPPNDIIGSSKTMRKLKCGDSVHFVTKGVDSNGTVGVRGIITFFNKH